MSQYPILDGVGNYLEKLFKEYNIQLNPKEIKSIEVGLKKEYYIISRFSVDNFLSNKLS